MMDSEEVEIAELGEQTPLWEEVEANYDSKKERFQLSDWKADQQLVKNLVNKNSTRQEN